MKRPMVRSISVLLMSLPLPCCGGQSVTIVSNSEGDASVPADAGTPMHPPPLTTDATVDSPDDAYPGVADSAPLFEAGPDAPNDTCVPVLDIEASCSHDCRYAGLDCNRMKCGSTALLALPSAEVMPYLIRTPEHPGIDGACAAACGAGNIAAGIGFTVSPSMRDASFEVTIAVRVSPPWMIVGPKSLRPFCMDPGTTIRDACALFHPSQGPLFIVTKDPNAPARNVQFDVVPPGTSTCP
jgi:hypothetical protein